MSKQATQQLIVLFESEIRDAATAFHKLRERSEEITKSDGRHEDDEEFGRLLRSAMNLASAALYGAEDADAALVLTRSPIEWAKPDRSKP